MALDRTNLRMLELLQKNGRISVTELARTLGRSESTLRERLGVLEQRGVVRRYQAVVDPHALGYGVRAVIRADADGADHATLAKGLAAIPNVILAFITTGDRPVRIHVLARDLEALDQLVQRRIAPLGLQRLEAGAVLHWLVDERPAPAPREATVEESANGGHPLAEPVPAPAFAAHPPPSRPGPAVAQGRHL